MTDGGSSTRLTRRAWLSGAAAVAATAIGPFVWTRRASAAGKVVIRTIGGAYEEANDKAIFEPFTKATFPKGTSDTDAAFFVPALKRLVIILFDDGLLVRSR